MLWTQARCVFMGFILCISDVQGQKESAVKVCALKGSTVQLNCSAKHLTTSKWFTVYWNHNESVLSELSADGRVTYNMSGENDFTLTIKDLRESDAKSYCCREDTELCWKQGTELRVADLQVKVLPSTEGHTVTLMCSTSCPLTKNPVTYVWYKNREYLYNDWSPWYQELVSSDDTVRYSCAVKGYEDLRAPEVSVDAVTSTCFSVTYAKGKMCSYQNQSEDEPCSITYPTELRIKRSAVKTFVKMTCESSCAAIHPQTSYVWYWNNNLRNDCENQHLTVLTSVYDIVSCALKGHEDLHSNNICPRDRMCWTSNYVTRRICVLEGLSVNISSRYVEHWRVQSKLWYRLNRPGEKNSLLKEDGRVKFDDSVKKVHVLRINNVERNDSGLYMFKLAHYMDQNRKSELFRVTLVVTGLTVTMIPSAVVTEGQTVTLTCTTSCPLPEDTAYTWYLNGRRLTLPGNQTKHLVLEPVGSEHAGNYSCAVVSAHNIRSSDEALVINLRGKSVPILNGIKLVLISLLPAVFLLWWMRKKTCASTAGQGDKLQTGQDLGYENIPLRPIHRAAPMDPAVQ